MGSSLGSKMRSGSSGVHGDWAHPFLLHPLCLCWAAHSEQRAIISLSSKLPETVSNWCWILQNLKLMLWKDVFILGEKACGFLNHYCERCQETCFSPCVFCYLPADFLQASRGKKVFLSSTDTHLTTCVLKLGGQFCRSGLWNVTSQVSSAEQICL